MGLEPRNLTRPERGFKATRDASGTRDECTPGQVPLLSGVKNGRPGAVTGLTFGDRPLISYAALGPATCLDRGASDAATPVARTRPRGNRKG